MLDLFADAGPFAYVLLMMFPAAGVFTLVCAGLAVAEFRVPSPVWLLGALALTATSSLGTIFGLQMTLAALGHASIETKPMLAGAGLSVALIVDVFGAAMAAVVASGGAWFAGLASLRSDPDDPWNFGMAAGISAVVCLGAAGVFLVSPSSLLGIPLAVFAAGPPLAIAALRGSENPERAARLADLRVTVALLSATAVLCATGATWLCGRSIAAQARSRASAETIAVMVDHADQIMGGSALAGLIGTVLLGGVGVAAAAPLAKHLANRHFALSLLGWIAVLAPLLGLRGYETVLMAQVEVVVATQVGVAPSDDLMSPYSEKATAEPHRREVDLVVSRRDIVADGMWVLDLQVGIDVRTGEERIEFPSEELDNGRVPKVLEALKNAGSGQTLLLQCDRRLPWSVVKPLLATARQAGATRLELLVLTPEGYRIVELDEEERIPPEATLEDWVKSREGGPALGAPSEEQVFHIATAICTEEACEAANPCCNSCMHHGDWQSQTGLRLAFDELPTCAVDGCGRCDFALEATGSASGDVFKATKVRKIPIPFTVGAQNGK